MNYEANKESITQKYCENKDKPKMKCQGKCHLNKQIKQQDKQTDHDKSLVKEINEMPSNNTDKENICFELYSDSYSPNFFYSLGKIAPHNSFVFHPPTL